MVIDNGIFNVVKSIILPGRLSTMEWWRHCWSLLLSTRKFAQLSTPISLSTTVHIHDAIETESSKLLKNSTENGGRFCLFTLSKTIFKKSLCTFNFSNKKLVTRKPGRVTKTKKKIFRRSCLIEGCGKNLTNELLVNLIWYQWAQHM